MGSFLKDEKFLELDEADYIPPGGVEDRDLWIVVFLQLLKERRINSAILIDHENTVYRDHVIADLLEPEIDGVLKDLNFLRAIAILLAIMKE